MRRALTLPPDRVALALVDFQEEQRRDLRFPVEGFDRLLGQTARLLAAARGAGVPVLHAAYVRDFTIEPPRPHEPLAAGGTPWFSDPAAGDLTAICAEVAPEPGEFVALKQDASCFSSAAYRKEIAALSPEWLILAGVWTEACIAKTVFDAQAAGLRVLLVKDAIGSGTPFMHRVALLHLANRLYGGAIADTDTVTALLAGATRDTWQIEGVVPIRFTAATMDDDYDAL